MKSLSEPFPCCLIQDIARGYAYGDAIANVTRPLKSERYGHDSSVD